jgi:hypothetical protein
MAINLVSYIPIVDLLSVGESLVPAPRMACFDSGYDRIRTRQAFVIKPICSQEVIDVDGSRKRARSVAAVASGVKSRFGNAITAFLGKTIGA